MKTISLVYISLSGNTESFVTRLKDYLLSQYKGIEVQKIHIKDLVKEGKNFYEMDHPYVAFLPTYLEGGNGVDNGVTDLDSVCFCDGYPGLSPAKEKGKTSFRAFPLTCYLFDYFW